MRKIYLFLVILFFLFSKGTYAQYTPVDWQHIYNGVATPVIEIFPLYVYGSNKLVKYDDGRFLFAATINEDIAFYKLDGQGNVLWTKTLGGSRNEEANVIKQTKDGGFIVAGSTVSNDGLFSDWHGATDAFVAKMDSIGNVEWVKLIGGSSADAFYNIELLSDGFIAVGKTESTDGDIVSNNGAADVLVTRFNLDGSVVWTKTYGGQYCESAYNLLINKNEEIIIAGMYNSSGMCSMSLFNHRLLLGVNKEGIQLWKNENINTPSSETGVLGNLTFNADSSQFYSIVKKDNVFNPFLYKFNSITGALIFTRQLDINTNTDVGATMIRRTPDNHYLLPLASPMLRSWGVDTTRTYLAEIDDDGTVLSVNQFDFGEETIVGVQERDNERLILSSNRRVGSIQIRLSSFLPGNIVINSFFPLTNITGNEVRIKGKFFTGATAVNFGGIPAASFSVLNDSVITAIVGTGATGQVSVSSPRGTAAKDGFTFVVIPNTLTITSFAPATAGFLHTVIIKGTHFTGVQEIRFGGWPAYSFEVINDSTISAKVGRGGADDKIYMTSMNAFASIGGFTYLPPLPVSGFSPAYGTVGSTVRINGERFSDTLAKNHVYFGQAEATILEASPSSLLVTVPPGATSAQIIVTVDTTSGYTRDVFMVIQPGEDAVKSFSFDGSPFLSASNVSIRSFVSGDFNGDGVADLAVVSKGTANLSVFKSTSSLDSITFETGLIFSLPGNGMDVITGDVDMDGKMDILVKTNQQNFISIFHNTSAGGNISFAPSVDIPSFSYPNNEDHNNLLALYDMNGDGRPELLTSNADQTFSILKNTGAPGNIQFEPGVNLSYYPFSFVVRDFNGDNKPDIAMLSNGSFFVVFKNTSEGGNISLVKTPGMNLPFGRIIGITANDFDGDGKQDIAAIVTERNLTIFRNTSITDSITFTPKSDWQLAYYPNYINSGDFDSDGKSDIVIGNNSRTTFSVFRNISSPGNLALTFKQDFSTGSNAAESVVTDINNDGKPDIATIAEDDGRIFIARNNLHEPFIQSFKPASAAKGDTITLKGGNFTGTSAVRFGYVVATSYTLLNDSTITAVVDTGATGTVSVNNTYGRGSKAGFTFGVRPVITSFLPVKGSPGTVVTIKGKNFSTATGVSFGGSPAASFVFINDSTINAKVDTGSTGNVMISTLFGTDALSGFSFGLPPIISTFSPGHGATGDTITIIGKYFIGSVAVSFGEIRATSFAIINDTTISAVVGAGASGNVGVTNSFRTTYKPGFVFGMLPVITSFSPLSGPAGTIVTIKGKSFSPVASENIVYFGAGRATVTSATDSVLTVLAPVTTTYHSITVTLKGLTTTGDLPFVLTFAGGNNINTQSFLVSKIYPATGKTRFIGIGDLDVDGKSDLTIGNTTNTFVRVIRNRGLPDSIAFGQQIDYHGANKSLFTVLEDLDGDGKKDMVVGSIDHEDLYVYRNITDVYWIDFAPKQIFTTRKKPVGAVVRDLNGDGRPEIITVNGQDSSISILTNNGIPGAISFSGRIDLSAPYSPNSVDVRDFNEDGRPDIFIAGQDGIVSVFLNNGEGTGISFSIKLQMNALGPVNVLSSGDIDGDGKTDIIVGKTGTTGVSIFRNVTDSDSVLFAPPAHLLVSGPVSSIAVGDLNGDAKPDLAVTTGTGVVAVLENASSFGNISFQALDAFAVGDTLCYVAIGDLDGDGKLDMALADNAGTKYLIVRNRMAEAQVIPSGTNPVTGGMTNKVTIDPTVQTFQGHPYVQRHYDITPANDPATATATLTLYFTQQEFDNYNAHPAHGLDLPHHAGDNLNKANLRVYQYHGFSTTSLPGSYSGNGLEIDPDDAKIVWNAVTLQWEVTFEVNGFSGFFLGTASNSILPITLLSFTGNVKEQKVLLQWTTTREINVTHFEIQRRDNNSDFITIGKITAAGSNNLEYDYQYSDALGTSPVYYYRLKIVDIDQSATYSKTITIRSSSGNAGLVLNPNPAKEYVIVKHPAKNAPSRIRIVDMFGKTLKTVTVASNSMQTRIVLGGLPKGSYTLVWDGETEITSQVLIIQ